MAAARNKPPLGSRWRGRSFLFAIEDRKTAKIGTLTALFGKQTAHLSAEESDADVTQLRFSIIVVNNTAHDLWLFSDAVEVSFFEAGDFHAHLETGHSPAGVITVHPVESILLEVSIESLVRPSGICFGGENRANLGFSAVTATGEIQTIRAYLEGGDGKRLDVVASELKALMERSELNALRERSKSAAGKAQIP